MKKFFKNNLAYIIWFAACLAIMALGVIFSVALIVGAVGMGVLFLVFAVKSKHRYEDLKAESADNNDYFDATKVDYDEDVYYIGNPNDRRKKIGKSAISKFGALVPTIAFALIGLGLIIMSLTFVFKLFF